MGLLSKILGDPNKKIIEDLQRIVNEINDSESKFEKMSDDQLKNYSNNLQIEWLLYSVRYVWRELLPAAQASRSISCDSS